MACKKCGAAAQQEFPAEVSLNFPGLQRIHLSPVYAAQTLLVCLNCGYSELILPEPKLDQLRNGMAESRSQTA
jgi:hypothetical protein